MKTLASTMKASRSSCISLIRCTACAGACKACSRKCAPADGQPTKDDGSSVPARRMPSHVPTAPRRSNTSRERIMPNRRTTNVIALAGVMLLLALGPGRTEDYPSRPVRLMIATSEATMLPFLKKSYRYDPVTDFAPIALLATSWTVFAVNPKVPANTLAELIAYSKANPGRVRYGSGGVGGALHIAVEMLRLKTGADLVHVPYRGGGQAASDAVAGQIEMVSLGLASARVAEGGALRVLAQTGPRRHPMFADVPTTAELGMPDVRMDTWFGLLAPPDTPEPIVARLVRESDAVVNQPGFREKLFRIGCDAAWMPPTEFGIFMRDDAKKWEKLIPAMGIPMVD